MPKPRVILIDDELQILDALERILQDEFEIIKYHDPEIFLKDLNDQKINDISVIICDQRMSSISGAEVLAQCALKIPDTIRILLTGYSDLETAIEAINKGQIYRYLSKPWEPYDFIFTIKEASKKYELLEASKKLTQAKNKFMILINHELKTPLTSILNFSELLSQTPLNEIQKNYLNKIHNQSLRLKKLINDTLIILQSDINKPFEHITKFSIDHIEFPLSEETQKLLNQKKLKLEKNIELSRTFIGNPLIVTQCFERLIENAVKYAFPETIIRISIKKSLPHQAKFSVENEGPPVPSSVISDLGKPFIIPHDIFNHHKGSGLGLSVVVSLLKQINKTLYLMNHPPYVIAFFELGVI